MLPAARKQIEAAYGIGSYWKEAIERGHRIYDRDRNVDVTAERYVDICHRRSLARAILDAPPDILPPDLCFNEPNDYEY